MRKTDAKYQEALDGMNNLDAQVRTMLATKGPVEIANIIGNAAASLDEIGIALLVIMSMAKQEPAKAQAVAEAFSVRCLQSAKTGDDEKDFTSNMRGTGLC